MDPEQNNLYPNNNQMPNNQPLDNQGMDNISTQGITPDINPVQPQPTQDYQQPVNQPNVPEPIPQPAPQPTPQPAPQPMQQNFNQPPKKKKTGLIIGIIIAAIVLAVGAVFLVKHLQKAGTKTTDNKVADSSQTKTKKPVETSKKGDTDGVLLGDSYKVPGKNIVVDIPNYHPIEHGYTKLFIVRGEKYVAVTIGEDWTTTELSVAHADAFAVFVGNIQSNSLVNSLSVTTDSIETINGVEVYKYEGTLNCGIDTVYDAYVIGYSFIMDGVPCNITGSVINKDQPADMIAEIKATVEAMIKTLRSEK